MSDTHSRFTKFKKVKWLFGKEIEIPKSWFKCQLKDIGNLSAGGTPSTFEKKFWDKGTIPWISSSEVKNNRIYESEKKITKLGLQNSATKLFPKGTVLIAITGFGMTRGRTAILEIDATTNQSIVGITTNSKILNHVFLWHLLRSMYWTVRNFAQGTQQPGLNLEILENFQIVYPAALQEQTQIASILSGVDATIEATQKVIEKTERLKKGLMQQLLTKGINHEKFKMVRWLFGKEIKIPKEWEIKQLISVSSQKPEYGSGDAALPYNSKLARYIRITDIDDEGRLKDEKVSVKLVNNKQYVLNQDDFLFARTGSVGRTFVFSTNYGLCVYAGYLIRFKLNKRKILPIFLHYYTLSNTYWTWLTSELTQGVQPNVNAQQYSKLPIVLPSLTEQNKIASILSGVDAYIQKNHEYKKKLEELKKGLMQKLLTGQLRVKI